MWATDENNSRAFKFGEYYHSNALKTAGNGLKDALTMAQEIIDYIVSVSKQPTYSFIKRKGLTVHVDYGGGGLAMIDILRDLTRQAGLP